MTIPRATKRAHFMPYWYGDSPGAVVKAHSKKYKFMDINYQLSLDDIPMAMHWGDIRRNGYKFVMTGERGGKEIRRALTKSELNSRVSSHSNYWLKRLRRTRRPGKSYASRVGPVNFADMLKVCRKYSITMCPELKDYEFARNPEIAKRMHAQVVQAKVNVYPMTLVTMKGWAGKMRMFHEAGFETALLAHGARKPAAYSRYAQWIDVVWGSWRR